MGSTGNVGKGKEELHLVFGSSVNDETEDVSA